MTKCFIDTNVVVYANDANDQVKQQKALGLISSMIRARSGALSIQVLQEYANTALLKLGQEGPVVLRQVRLLESLTVIQNSPRTVRRSIEIRSAYGISFWDASIVAAAEEADCHVLLSEDLNAGQFYAGVNVVNPFAEDFDTSNLLN